MHTPKFCFMPARQAVEQLRDCSSKPSRSTPITKNAIRKRLAATNCPAESN
jgi:hypothetical protein